MFKLKVKTLQHHKMWCDHYYVLKAPLEVNIGVVSNTSKSLKTSLYGITFTAGAQTPAQTSPTKPKKVSKHFPMET